MKTLTMRSKAKAIRDENEGYHKKGQGMFCKNCGKEIQKDWAVCPNCGTELKNSACEDIRIKSEKKRKVRRKKHKILNGVLGAFIILGGILLWEGLDINLDPLLRSGRPSASVKDRIKKDANAISFDIVSLDETTNAEETQKTVSDFSGMDFEELTNKTEESLEEFGLEKSGNAYSALNGNVQVSCNEGKVRTILIKKDGNFTPSFHSVKIGMDEERAKRTLSGIYPELEDSSVGFKFLNFDTGESVECELADGKVTAIRYQALSELETAQLKALKEELAAEYIFPDSDKQYLSEEEIKNKDASQLLINRKE